MSLVRILCLWVFGFSNSIAFAQQSTFIPGSPNGDLFTELIQSRAYCRSLERQLEIVGEKFPDQQLRFIAAKSAWMASPFYQGGVAIEQDILEKGGVAAADMLKKLDDEAWSKVEELSVIDSSEKAVEFLDLVAHRSKGGIEVELVRGNLLWQYKPYQVDPEKEFSAGYANRVVHTYASGSEVAFDVPFSWKMDVSPNPEVMFFRNCYGHGNVWMTVFIGETVDRSGNPIPASEAFESASAESKSADFAAVGVTITSFEKTRLNGHPAFLYSREQPYEQLGTKAHRAGQAVRAFFGDYQVTFQINTLGPVAKRTAVERIEKNEELFKMIAGSLRISE